MVDWKRSRGPWDHGESPGAKRQIPSLAHLVSA
jgi:hypothetical protein